MKKVIGKVLSMVGVGGIFLTGYLVVVPLVFEAITCVGWMMQRKSGTLGLIFGLIASPVLGLFLPIHGLWTGGLRGMVGPAITCWLPWVVWVAMQILFACAGVAGDGMKKDVEFRDALKADAQATLERISNNPLT